MKKNTRIFCELVATDLYEPWLAVEMVWGDKYEDSQEKADFLLEDDAVKKKIKKLKKAHTKKAEVSDIWIKNKLVTLIERSTSMDGDVLDVNAVRSALDMLNKMNGNYNDDNSATVPVTLKMTF